PRSPGDQIVSTLRRFAVVGRIRDDRALQKLLRIRRLLDAPETQPPIGRRSLDRMEQVVDRLVRMRRHADPFAARKHSYDGMRGRVGFARAWRPLNQQMTAIQSSNSLDFSGDLLRVITDPG